MKKVLLTLLVVAMIATSLVISTSAAEIPTENLEAYFKFEGNLVNEVTGEAVGRLVDKFSEDYLWEDDECYWVSTAPDGKYAFCMGEGDGFSTETYFTGDFTVGLWIMEDFDGTSIHPYVWAGPQDQSSGECWIGIWNVDISNSWSKPGITLGSNDSAGARLEIVPEEAAQYDTEADISLQWTHVVVTGVYDEATDTYTTTLYVNGENVGTCEGMPNFMTDDPEGNGATFYVNGVNYWSDPNSNGAIDELVVYSAALSDDEVASLYNLYDTPPTFADYDEWEASKVELGETSGDDPVDTDPVEDTNKKDDESKADDKAEGESTTASTTEETKEEGGCGSAMGAAAAIVALVSVFGCAIVKKH